MSSSSSSHKVVFTIIETAEGKSVWRRVGAAFTNRDASLTVLLDALPVNGRLHIRDQSERDEKRHA